LHLFNGFFDGLTETCLAAAVQISEEVNCSGWHFFVLVFHDISLRNIAPGARLVRVLNLPTTDLGLQTLLLMLGA